MRIHTYIRGFSLLELIIAMGLFLGIAVTSYAAFAFATSIFSRTEHVGADLLAARLAMADALARRERGVKIEGEMNFQINGWIGIGYDSQSRTYRVLTPRRKPPEAARGDYNVDNTIWVNFLQHQEATPPEQPYGIVFEPVFIQNDAVR